MAERPTLSDVARQAQVSRQTVSNVINTPQMVKEDTRARVLAAIEQTGYRLNTAARQLRTGRSHQIGLAIRPMASGGNRQVLDQFLHALAERAQQHDHRIVVFAASDEQAELDQYESLVENADLDGFVLTDTHPSDPRTQWLTEHQVPFVTFGRPWEPRGASYSWVDVDGAAGVHEATTHLLTSNYRSVAFLGWPEGSGSGDDRRSGWERAVSEHGARTVLQARVENTVEAAAVGARELFAAGADAVVCASDTLAIGTLTVARELLARGDATDPIGIVGFDDSPIAQTLGLSSVSQEVDDVADDVITALLNQVSSRTQPYQRLVTPRLVIRNSSAFTLRN